MLSSPFNADAKYAAATHSRHLPFQPPHAPGCSQQQLDGPSSMLNMLTIPMPWTALQPQLSLPSLTISAITCLLASAKT